MKKICVIITIAVFLSLCGCQRSEQNSGGSKESLYFYRNKAIYSYSEKGFEKITECDEEDFLRNTFSVYKDWLYYEVFYSKFDSRMEQIGQAKLFRKNIKSSNVEMISEDYIRSYIVADECIYFIGVNNVLKRMGLDGSAKRTYGETNIKTNFYDLLDYNESILLNSTEGLYIVDKNSGKMRQVTKKWRWYCFLFNNVSYSFYGSYDKENNLRTDSIIELNVETGKKEILYQTQEEVYPLGVGEDDIIPYYNESRSMIIKDKTMYFTMDEGTYSLSLKTKEVKKISDFSCLYVKGMIGNRIICYFPTRSDVMTALEPEEYKLVSLNVETGEIEEHPFP